MTRTRYDKCKSELRERDGIISAKEKELKIRDDTIKKKDEIIKKGAVTAVANEREMKILRGKLKAEKKRTEGLEKRWRQQEES